MPFKYSCFISYCHGQYDLMKGFIEQLKKALKAYLEPWLDEEVYIDEERLLPGYKYNEKLAEAICQSICMIVIYSPKYEKHTYCLREYTAMELLEEKRNQLVGQAAHGRGMIIPIIFRGEEDLPAKIKDRTHYCDFSKFTTATTDISGKQEYIDQIEKIAKIIYEHYKAFQELDPCSECISFELPAEEKIKPWREKAKPPVSPMPFHEGGR